jgi:hypothetical protein
MAAGTVLVILLLIARGMYTSPVRDSNVTEIESIVHIQETINVQRIHAHLYTWAKEASTSDKLIKLIAAKAMRETDMRLRTLQLYTGYSLSDRPFTMDTTNQHNRFKRNILGDLIHSITGLATDDELKKQMRIDEEIRNKISSTLTRQVSFEKTLATVYSNLTKEEEMMERKLEELIIQRKQDKYHLIRLMTLSKIAQDDMEDLEDVIDGIRNGHLNTRHSLKLSHKIGLPDQTKYEVQGTKNTTQGLQIELQSRLLSSSNLVIEDAGKYLKWTTNKRTYIVHPSRTTFDPLMEEEVRYKHGNCDTCAVMIHTGYRRYKIVSGGTLNCNDEQLNYTEGSLFQLGPMDNCMNRLVEVGVQGLQLKALRIDLSADASVDALLLHKMVKDGAETHRMGAAVQQHAVSTLQIQHDLNMAEQEVKNFIQDTKLNVETDYMEDSFTWAAIAVVGLIVIAILLCIFVRMCRFAGCGANKSS